jgi:radical SAM protein with 4Fe4S-binding SPASM domain
MHYYIGIFKKLTFYKLVNFIKLGLGFYYSRLINRPVQLALPVFVSIEPTTSCNLRCPQCPSGLREFTRPTGMLNEGLFQRMILQMKSHLHTLTFYFQGEPYLNPDFLKMVAFANANNIYTSTSTNAHYLSGHLAKETVKSGLDKLIISVDGITQEIYGEYRKGGNYEKVIEGTREILRQKKLLKSHTPHVVWQFVVFNSNQHQVKAIKDLGREIGVDEVKIKTAQIYDFQNSQELIPDEKYARYKKMDDGTFVLKNKMLNQCWRMWQGCVITWDGKVVPCCFDKDARYRLGNLAEEPFRNIWFSEPYNKFRRSILKNRQQIDICTNCTEGTRVWS